MSTINARAVDRISFMLSLPDKARVDATLVPGRTYYRFATEDSIEDGELSSPTDSYDSQVADLLNVFTSTIEAPASIEPLKLTLFINNRLVKPAVLNLSAVKKFAARMSEMHAEFNFMHSLIAAANQ